MADPVETRFLGLLGDMAAPEQGRRGLFGLTPERETLFQRDMQFAPGYRDWRREFINKVGGPPNLDSPGYDYRLAWARGIAPQPYENDGGQFHWPSQTPQGEPLKGQNHPTLWMEDFMQKFGRDPLSPGQTPTPQESEYLRALLTKLLATGGG